MKHHTLLLMPTFFFASLSLHAQDKEVVSLRSAQQAAIQYDDVSVGRNINITYHRGLGKGWYLYGGFKYNINSKYYKNDWGLYTSYYKGTYAKSIDESLGAKLGLEKMLWQPNADLAFSAFYELQFTRGHYDDKYIGWGWPGLVGSMWGYTFKEERTIGLTSFESNIGLVAHMKISDRLLFRLQAGVGLSYFTTTDSVESPLSGNRALPLPLARMFGLGLEYNLRTAAQTTDSRKRKRKGKEEISFRSLSLSYDDLQTGRNFNIVYRTPLKGNTYIYGGIKLNMGSRFYSDYALMGHNYYFKQFRPAGIGERFGLKAGLEHYVSLPNSKVKLFGFYDFQLMRATVKNLDTLYRFYSGNLHSGARIGKEREDEAHPVYRPYGPVFAFENYAGAGLLLPLTGKLHFRIQGGVGLNYYLGPEKDDWGREWKADRLELSRMFGLGLQYSLGEKN